MSSFLLYFTLSVVGRCCLAPAPIQYGHYLMKIDNKPALVTLDRDGIDVQVGWGCFGGCLFIALSSIWFWVMLVLMLLKEWEIATNVLLIGFIAFLVSMILHVTGIWKDRK